MYGCPVCGVNMVGWFPGSLQHKIRLSPIEILILFGLNDRNLSGYALMESIAEETGGRIRLKSGTLYPALKRLSDKKKRNPPPIFYDADEKAYGLTAAGKKLLAAFPAHIDSALEAGQRYLTFIVKHGGKKHYKDMCDRMLEKDRPWAFPWVCSFDKELKTDKNEHLERLERLREQLTKRLERVDTQIAELKRGKKHGTS